MASPGSLASNPPPRWGAPGDDLVGDPSGRRQARDPGSGPRSLGPSEIPTVSIASHTTPARPPPSTAARGCAPCRMPSRTVTPRRAGPRPAARRAPRPGADPVGRPRRLRQPRPRGIHPGLRAGGAGRGGRDPHLLQRAPRHRLALAGHQQPLRGRPRRGGPLRGRPRGRRRRLHPQHHRLGQPARPGAAPRHLGGRLRLRAPRDAAALARPRHGAPARARAAPATPRCCSRAR